MSKTLVIGSCPNYLTWLKGFFNLFPEDLYTMSESALWEWKFTYVRGMGFKDIPFIGKTKYQIPSGDTPCRQLIHFSYEDFKQHGEDPSAYRGGHSGIKCPFERFRLSRKLGEGIERVAFSEPLDFSTQGKAQALFPLLFPNARFYKIISDHQQRDPETGRGRLSWPYVDVDSAYAVEIDMKVFDPDFFSGVKAKVYDFWNYNYLANARMVFNAAFARARKEEELTPPEWTSEMVQALYVAARNEGEFDLNVSKLGSGKYAPWEFDPNVNMRLIESGLVKDVSDENPTIIQKMVRKARGASRFRNKLTPFGYDFLSQLHPDCEDPDQIHRVIWWGENLEWHEAKHKCETYLKKLFRKQVGFTA